MLKLSPNMRLVMPNSHDGVLNENAEYLTIFADGAGVDIVGDIITAVREKPLMALWDNNCFVGLAVPIAGEAECGVPVDADQVQRINEAIADGRILTSREVEAAFEDAIEPEYPYDRKPIPRISQSRIEECNVLGLGAFEVLEDITGLNRWTLDDVTLDGTVRFRRGPMQAGVRPEVGGVTILDYAHDSEGDVVATIPFRRLKAA
ncbi:hypothetical protein [Croceicoccus gelatinilyticus]|uniref:hypothetical protein n=1 Tax=Croceicoccus gelatinilyticus TaxID=2835536 RepID=UPI001BCD2E23|nr:hypothetical protein [Croceicoccus gelatinilyticus]MBS7671628.1 hypothetical protein [Croceicoccus gelatinilyticus]